MVRRVRLSIDVELPDPEDDQARTLGNQQLWRLTRRLAEQVAGQVTELPGVRVRGYRVEDEG
jgi:hypothetical protein